MAKLYAFVLASLVLTLTPVTSTGQTSDRPETVVVHNGPVTMHAMVWRPQGRGPFPGILLNHGSGRSREQLERLGPYERNAQTLGPVFSRHGFVFLYLFRHGVGTSSDQGANAFDLMNKEAVEHGEAARNTLQLRLLENRDMDDALSGLKFLRALRYVDAGSIALVVHSFGGSLTVLLAEREPNVRAVVVFSGAGFSFDRSPELRARLLTAMDRIAAPVFFIHAENDYSLSSGKVLDARREQIGKPHRLKIYPPIGRTVDDGHDFLHLGVNIWEPDVFAFLSENMRK
jgi:carboxymethylenebutenolidase